MARPETIESLISEVRTLESKVDLLSQKLGNVEKNEEVIGRTLIALNARIKRLEEQSGAGGRGAASGELKNYATKQELAQIRYVIDSINPLEYATIPQVKALLNERLEKFSRESAPKSEPREERSAGSGISRLFKKL
ncbi:hypothetical protein HY095_03265 [Candidatus Micrarchaeota archaeon]|nr:hypothetical protein [Candidatus Micrarchaeota archaeon]